MLARILGGVIGTEETIAAAATGGDNAPVSVTLQGGPNTKLALSKIAWSYSGTPTGGRISMTGPTVLPDLDVTAGGPGGLQFGAVVAPAGTPIVITLAAGGVGVIGKLYAEGVMRG